MRKHTQAPEFKHLNFVSENDYADLMEPHVGGGGTTHLCRDDGGGM